MRNPASDRLARADTSEWFAEATGVADTAWAERSQVARLDLSAMAVRRCHDAALVAFTLGPLPIECAMAALERQTELAAPSKLACFRVDEPVVLAEVAANGDGRESDRQVHAALAAAFRWLSGDTMPDREHAVTLADVHAAAHELGWPVTELTENLSRIDVRGSGDARRLFASALGCTHVRLALPPCVLRIAGAHAARALALFALEANARLRFTRLGVAREASQRARVSWEVVAASAQPHDLITAVEALTVARNETERAMHALGTAAIANAYLKRISSME